MEAQAFKDLHELVTREEIEDLFKVVQPLIDKTIDEVVKSGERTPGGAIYGIVMASALLAFQAAHNLRSGLKSGDMGVAVGHVVSELLSIMRGCQQQVDKGNCSVAGVIVGSGERVGEDEVREQERRMELLRADVAGNA